MVLEIRVIPLLLLIVLFSACTLKTDKTVTDKPVDPLATQTSVGQEYYPLTKRTGLDEVDRILVAVETGDIAGLRTLIGFTKVRCARVEGLGGPPKCLESEADGTVVEVLPFLGSEGSFIRRADIMDWPGITVSGLYAIYQVSETAYSEEYCPAGKFAIMFVAPEDIPGIVLQVRDGKIVRIDYVFDVDSRSAILERDASEMILAPVSKK